MNIFVTDGDNRAALAITRSLGRQGHRIIIGEKSQPSLAQASRFCADSVVYPDPWEHPASFMEAMPLILKERSIDVLVPVAEVTTALIVDRKSVLERSCRVACPDPAAFNLAADKMEMFLLAQKLSIPVPDTVLLRQPGDKPELQALQFPVVIKPHRSRHQVGGKWQASSVSYAENQKELEAMLSDMTGAQYPILLQQRIIGPGVGVFACYQRGQCVALFGHKRIREKPPSGGVSTLRESISVSPPAKRYAQALLNYLKWHGVAMVEFKLDGNDGQLKLMEINGRFWGSLQLAIDAGVDFPALLLQSMVDERVTPVNEYRVGIKSRWFLGDLDALLMRLLKSDAELHLPPGHEGRLRALMSFIAPSQQTYNEIARLSDMKPALYEATRWFMQGMK